MIVIWVNLFATFFIWFDLVRGGGWVGRIRCASASTWCSVLLKVTLGQFKLSCDSKYLFQINVWAAKKKKYYPLHNIQLFFTP